MRVWNPPPGFGKPGINSTSKPIVLSCRFISPVFGGGVDPMDHDPVTPVRVPAIRGQLGYWWRATHSDLSLEELRQRETKLFDAGSGPGCAGLQAR
ncbi:MAG: hypothetical protein MUF54_17150 [Polyangiaceae bacterium]|nr:hypothetical protein [Polyangiaceae bacterium]